MPAYFGNTQPAFPQHYLSQGKIPLFYYWCSKLSSKDNFVTNFIYDTANDYFQFIQICSFGLLAREEWKNPFTGSRFGNLDGTPNYDPASGVINNLVVFNNFFADSMKGVRNGVLYLKGTQLSGGPIKKMFIRIGNFEKSLINGQISKGRGVKNIKAIKPLLENEEEVQTSININE